MTNTLAYYGTELITASKVFMLKAPVATLGILKKKNFLNLNAFTFF